MEMKSSLLIREYYETRKKMAIINEKIKLIDKKISRLRENNETVIAK